MGAEPYFYVVKYRPDVNAALQELRQREFQAGRYNPAMPFLQFPLDPGSPAPGPQHDSIAEAQEDADADGTRSILDLERVADEPDFGAASPLPDEVLLALFGTTRPTRQMVERNSDFWEDVERGHGIYIILYRDDRPDEIFFGGYSYD